MSLQAVANWKCQQQEQQQTKKNNPSSASLLESLQTTEATAERLSPIMPETLWIGTERNAWLCYTSPLPRKQPEGQESAVGWRGPALLLDGVWLHAFCHSYFGFMFLVDKQIQRLCFWFWLSAPTIRECLEGKWKTYPPKIINQCVHRGGKKQLQCVFSWRLPIGNV